MKPNISIIFRHCLICSSLDTLTCFRNRVYFSYTRVIAIKTYFPSALEHLQILICFIFYKHAHLNTSEKTAHLHAVHLQKDTDVQLGVVNATTWYAMCQLTHYAASPL